MVVMDSGAGIWLSTLVLTLAIRFGVDFLCNCSIYTHKGALYVDALYVDALYVDALHINTPSQHQSQHPHG